MPRSPAVVPETAARSPRYDLTPGSPDLNAFPRTEWAAAARRALTDAATADLGYTDPIGLPPLRNALAGYLSRVRGVIADPDRIVITAGFAQAVALLGGVLARRGVQRVAVEAYGIVEHRELLLGDRLTAVDLCVDRHGARTDLLATSDVGAVMLTPAHQFPLGAVLAPHRRAAVADWARSTGGWMIEDDYDGEFRFDRRPVGAVQPLDPDRIVYAGTASKTLAPGLRLGWLVVPTPVRDEVLAAKRADPAQNSALDQLSLATMITTGAYDRHVRRSRLACRRRRDQLITAVRRHLPELEITGIAAGLHLVLSLPEGMSEVEAEDRARRHDLIVRGLRWYATDDHDHQPALVIGFGRPAQHAFSGAVARLLAALDPSPSLANRPFAREIS